MTDTSPNPIRTWLLRIAGSVVVLGALLPLPALLTYRSPENAVVLGRYSFDYFIGMTVFVVGAVAITAVYVWAQGQRPLLTRMAAYVQDPLVAACVGVVVWFGQQAARTELRGVLILEAAPLDLSLMLMAAGLVGVVVINSVLPASPPVEGPQMAAYRRVAMIGAVLGVGVYGWLVLRTAFLTDDVYITLRTVDNFVAGYGLRWNVAERVQSYTHPLWMFVLSAGYALTREAFLTTLVISMVISLAAVLIVVIGLARTPAQAMLAALLLAMPKAFVEYSTSGLENPLTHLLLVLFLLVFLGEKRRPFVLGLVACLAALNRLDAILLFVPVLLYTLWEGRSVRTLLLIGAGFVPLAAWLLFSLYYYGFPFPNTAYAKLNTVYSAVELIERGMYYLYNSLRWDPLTLTTIAAGVVLVALNRSWKHRMVMAGAVLYVAYVVQVGGGFMSGRFLTGSFLAAVVVVAHIELPEQRVPVYAGLVAAIIALGVSHPLAPLRTDATFALADVEGMVPARYVGSTYWLDRGITDERAFYYQCLGLLSAGNYVSNCYVKTFDPAEAEAVSVTGIAGQLGYVLGPDVYVVDFYALTDPLLARLPGRGRVGHLKRDLPAGYIETLNTGQNVLADPQLAEFYEVLTLITQGDLNDPDRLRAIWQMNTGGYDHLLP